MKPKLKKIKWLNMTDGWKHDEKGSINNHWVTSVFMFADATEVKIRAEILNTPLSERNWYKYFKENEFQEAKEWAEKRFESYMDSFYIEEENEDGSRV